MLINKYIPDFQFNEIHKIVVIAHTNDAYNTTMGLDLSKSKLIEILFRMRGLPFINNKFSLVNKDMRITPLEEIPFIEFLYGFWFTTKTELVTDLKVFVENSKKYNAKVGWSFYFNERTDNTTEIITETRVLCLNLKTKLLFSIYWFFVKPFSG